MRFLAGGGGDVDSVAFAAQRDLGGGSELTGWRVAMVAAGRAWASWRMTGWHAAAKDGDEEEGEERRFHGIKR